MSYPKKYTFDYVAEPPSSSADLNAVSEADERGDIGIEDRPSGSTFAQLRHALFTAGFGITSFSHLLFSNRQSRKPQFQRETRRCRRSYVVGIMKRLLVTSPVMILSMFGILHLLQVMIGRSRLFWDANTIEFLPDLDRAHRFDNGFFRSTASASSEDVLPIPCHSHNDYWRREPLYDALSWGCTGVEADVWLFDEELYVGHTVSSLKREHTFRTLYINKLVELLDKMNHEHGIVEEPEVWSGVFKTRPQQTLTLLVDLKDNGHDAFPVLQKQLHALRERNYLTHWSGNEVVQRAVTVVATGDTPFDMLIANSTYRDVFYDAPLDRLWEAPRSPIDHQDPIHALDSEMDYGLAMSMQDSPAPNIHGINYFNTSTSYYASTSFSKTVGFVWRGHLSPRQMEIIRGQIRGAKRRGLKARFWNTPSWPIALRNHIWHVLVKEGADVLNVDDLAGAARQSWTMRVHQLW
ncbi:hypothetical protein M409DRAFT_31049 [Zasmidium cellare ATCC 36951]|uniref:Altered inheritance of mitochondria protein 6 n=1 Tax=Zasmidium cellare ATCC 36951 TaxID=1080233 RepID=A0A6A6BYF0_ZASCE|nr:uncharacterized protein M409DRAFT_31049 [Zasmidium cellare ATCC 36951]KAF2158436.1 hypothetical protein M409DRAFT_31049 [Zasmidium cellare ATCC 36951]